jgi:hypothetical protein
MKLIKQEHFSLDNAVLDRCKKTYLADPAWGL